MVSELVRDRAYATEAGTSRYARRHGVGLAADAYSQVARLSLSGLGLGTYLGRPDDATDAAYVAAVTEAVRRGINVFDTAANYRCQRSERAVGRALGALFASGELYRSEVLVASKAGFVAYDGSPPVDPKAWLQAQTVDRGLCKPDELSAGCHCMAPEFLTATLAQSLANLGLETVDVYFVHNPETQLQSIDRDRFDDRLRSAFEALEAAAEAGHLRAYGIATWSGLRALPHERDHVSLARAVRCAEEIAGTRHHFKAVQLPLSLSMPEALLLRNQEVQGVWLNALEAAERLGLVTFTSGTLHQGRLTRTRPAHVPPLPEPQRLEPPMLREFAASERDLLYADQRDAALRAWLHQPVSAALQFARSAPGVTTALCGMAGVAHVAENARLLSLLKAPPAWVQRAALTPTAAAYP